MCTEFYIEREKTRGFVGNIYKGRVLRVLPGMQAAFVDIGEDKAAFLYVSDVQTGTLQTPNHISIGDDKPLRSKAQTSIEQLITEGQSLLVQVTKEPIGNKGPRISTHISLPGRYLVYLPTVDHVGISRRITLESERIRLRQLVEEIRPPETGFIVRTASEDIKSELLERDMIFQINLYHDLLLRYDKAKAPEVLLADLGLILRSARDLFTSNIEKLVIDSSEDYLKLLDFTHRFMPQFVEHIELYRGREPIFDAYHVEQQINRALGRKVWLRSGGYIVIDHTEALTAIDVNTGRYVGHKDLEETILKINLEAAGEIAPQLRLRNIGGLIIIDFIDMEKEENREAVFQELKRKLEHDKAKTNALKLSEFGLVEMTRKRVKENIRENLCTECFHCKGKGYIKSAATVGYEILREINREVSNLSDRSLYVYTHREVSKFLKTVEAGAIDSLSEKHGKKISISVDKNLHIENYEIRSSPMIAQ